MRKDIKKITLRIFVFILLLGFNALPLQTPICIIKCNMEEHGSHSPIKNNTENNLNNLQLSNSVKKDCLDSNTIFFNTDAVRYYKILSNNLILVKKILTLKEDGKIEKKFSMKFIESNFSPPKNNSNKLYKKYSILLI